MSFRLLRLPLVALREVIKSMDMGKILLFRTLSKKCHQIVKASISKKASLEISFSFERNFINFTIGPKTHFGVESNNSTKFKWTRPRHVAEDEKLIKNMIGYFADFLKPTVAFDFDFLDIRQDSAMKLVRYCRQTNIQLSSIMFAYRDSVSPEYVREILEGCIEESGHLIVLSSLPKEFEYTPPPGGFKMEVVYLSDADWVNLDDFLQCERVFVRGHLAHMTPHYLNNVFKTIVNTECRIRSLFLYGTSFNQNNYPEIIKELSDSPLEAKGLPLCFKFKAKNGRRTEINFHEHILYFSIN